MQLRFVASESAFDHFRTTRAYLEEHGKPVAFYSDKHGIFRVNSKDAAGGDGVTQFGRALLIDARREACAQVMEELDLVKELLGEASDAQRASVHRVRVDACLWLRLLAFDK
jgi:hypothetical protein